MNKMNKLPLINTPCVDKCRKALRSLNGTYFFLSFFKFRCVYSIQQKMNIFLTAEYTENSSVPPTNHLA